MRIRQIGQYEYSRRDLALMPGLLFCTCPAQLCRHVVSVNSSLWLNHITINFNQLLLLPNLDTLHSQCSLYNKYSLSEKKSR